MFSTVWGVEAALGHGRPSESVGSAFVSGYRLETKQGEPPRAFVSTGAGLVATRSSVGSVIRASRPKEARSARPSGFDWLVALCKVRWARLRDLGNK
ncbi:hypothetical protein CVT26_004822 [Gymnopilus dilepis]|uniref:Uncharacterized protein n=1 Tax=Gymnopilus dilepis TaxID=231916 RepID=A0A409XZH5_9AGAR|nr:hypothetical protein CVT26_004822 [Gymnopilus dilepis]